MKHLIFSSKFILFLLAISSMIFIGCQKEEYKERELNVATTKRTYSNLLPPTLNGVIKFNNFEEYKETYLRLQALYESDLELFNSSFDVESDFISVFSKLNNDDFTNWENAYKPFITDPVLMVILNEHYEFQVGNALITYINNEDIITSDPSNTLTRNQIRQIIKGAPLKIGDVPLNTSWGKDTNESSYQLAWCGCEIEIEQICNKIRIFGKCKNLVGDGEGTVTIVQNNGLPQINRVVGNFEFFLTPNGPVRIDANAVADCFLSEPVFDVLNFLPGEVTCDKRERDTGWGWAQQGTEGMSIRVSYYQTFNTRWNSEIVSKNLRNGKWPKSKANRLECSIDASTRGVTCVIFRKEFDNDLCNSCKSESVGVNNGLSGGSALFRHCDGDVFGDFKKVINGITLTKKMDIDFDCCL